MDHNIRLSLSPRTPRMPFFTPWDPLGPPLDVPLDPQIKPDYQETSWLRRLLQGLPFVLFESYHTVYFSTHTVHFISRTFLGQFGLVEFQGVQILPKNLMFTKLLLVIFQKDRRSICFLQEESAREGRA